MSSRSLRTCFMAWLLVSLVASPLLSYSVIATAASLVFAVSIQGDDRPGTPQVLKATQGDHVTIEWSTNKKAVVHIHPYDIEQELAPGTPSRTELTAKLSGRFPVEAHFAARSGRRIVAYLEVQPR